LGAIVDARGADGEFPRLDEGALDGDGEENVGVVEIIFLE
jgi:hypothetical protein